MKRLLLIFAFCLVATVASHATVSTTTNRVTYTGTGANTALSVTFPFVEDDDLVVTRRVTATGVESTMVLTTDYTVTGGSFSTGTVTPVDGATDFPATVTWTIERNTDATQTTDYTPAGRFPNESHEQGLDKLVYLVQDRQEEVDRSLKYPVTDSTSIPSEIPSSVDRASKYLCFNASSEPISCAAPTSTSITTTYIETLLDDATSIEARSTLDAQQDVVTTQGDLVVGNFTGNAVRLAVGASGTVPHSNGTTLSWTDPKDVESTFDDIVPRGYIAGLILSNGTDTDHDIDISSGIAKDSTNTRSLELTATETIAIDASAGAGGPCAGSVANDTWYHVCLLEKDSDESIDACFSTDPACSSDKPAGYTEVRRIGSVRTNGSANIYNFDQHGDLFTWNNPQLDENDSATDYSSGLDIVLENVPLGVRVVAWINVVVDNLASAEGLYVSAKTQNNESASSVNAPLAQMRGNGSGIEPATLQIVTDTSQTIRARTESDNSIDLRVATLGFEDARGRDD